MLDADLKPYVDLAHAAGSLSLRFARIADSRAWASDPRAIREVAQQFQQLFSKPLTIQLAEPRTCSAVFVSPQGLGLLQPATGNLTDVVETLVRLADAAQQGIVDQSIRQQAGSLERVFRRLAAAAEHRAAIMKRPNELSNSTISPLPAIA